MITYSYLTLIRPRLNSRNKTERAPLCRTVYTEPNDPRSLWQNNLKCLPEKKNNAVSGKCFKARDIRVRTDWQRLGSADTMRRGAVSGVLHFTSGSEGALCASTLVTSLHYCNSICSFTIRRIVRTTLVCQRFNEWSNIIKITKKALGKYNLR